MDLSWDEAKRQSTLALRGLDFALAADIFVGLNFTNEDTRFDYGEKRMISNGFIGNRLCVVVWTQRGNSRHIISLRKANGKEQARFKARKMD
jgi:uncharacterized protein